MEHRILLTKSLKNTVYRENSSLAADGMFCQNADITVQTQAGGSFMQEVKRIKNKTIRKIAEYRFL